MSAPVIEVEGLSKRFGSLEAVADVSFAIAPGTVTALLGGNGAGKTTTLAMILGLITPTDGRITVMGVDMGRRRHDALAAMNFSSPYVDLPGRLTVGEILRVYGHLYGVARVRKQIRDLADDLDLVPFLKRPFRTLSSGQQTRAALAKSLINQPRLLLLDEPTVSLDPDTADWVRGYLMDYQQRTGAAILLASHNMSEVERMATDVMMMRGGRISDRGTPEALLRRYGRATMEEVFLAVARGEASSGSSGRDLRTPAP